MHGENVISERILITALEGNRQKLDGGAMFGNAPKPMWEKWIQPDALNRIELACRCLLIEWKGKRILCETGIGRFFENKLAERYGVFESEHKLLESLNKIGLNENEIDYVILSHMHFDHAGGLLPAYSNEYEKNNGKPPRLLFPKATYVVGKEAFERSKHPHPRDRASFIPGMADLLEKSGRLFIVEKNPPKELVGLIAFTFSHGHTPGHMHTILNGQKQRVIFAGDLVPGTSWVHLPVTMGYDRFAEQVIDEKKNMYESILKPEDYLFYTHDMRTAMSRIAKDDKGKFLAKDSVDNPQHFEI